LFKPTAICSPSGAQLTYVSVLENEQKERRKTDLNGKLFEVRLNIYIVEMTTTGYFDLLFKLIVIKCIDSNG